MPSPANEIISYREMCVREEVQTLQRGMNFRLNGKRSVILMSLRPNAPYRDRIEENGRVLIYEGHDEPKTKDVLEPKLVDQPEFNQTGSLTQNGLFHRAAHEYKKGNLSAEIVRVYQKIWSGVWTDNGTFRLVDAWREQTGKRTVFKFKLDVMDEPDSQQSDELPDLEHNRMIPAAVKLAVWKRDGGQCVTCGAKDNLHFDHVIPFSKGGSSLVAENIQLLCARHNLQKRDKIE